MKKILLSFILFIGLTLSGGAFAEVGVLSQNDRNFHEKIQGELGSVIEKKIAMALEKYKQKMNNLRWSEGKKQESHSELINRVENMITELLMSYPQDAKLPENIQTRYFILSYIKFELMMIDFGDMKNSQPDELRKRLTSVQYEVTQNSATEIPFQNKYFDNFDEGIYVDIVNGRMLFSSTDKFKTNTGWPAFSKPFSAEVVEEFDDLRFNMKRVEVKSRESGSHLGHIFKDGPKETGGLRYCINSASLDFIPKDEMDSQGYGEYLYLFDT